MTWGFRKLYCDLMNNLLWKNTVSSLLLRDCWIWTLKTPTKTPLTGVYFSVYSDSSLEPEVIIPVTVWPGASDEQLLYLLMRSCPVLHPGHEHPPWGRQKVELCTLWHLAADSTKCSVCIWVWGFPPLHLFLPMPKCDIVIFPGLLQTLTVCNESDSPSLKFKIAGEKINGSHSSSF